MSDNVYDKAYEKYLAEFLEMPRQLMMGKLTYELRRLLVSIKLLATDLRDEAEDMALRQELFRVKRDAEIIRREAIYLLARVDAYEECGRMQQSREIGRLPIILHLEDLPPEVQRLDWRFPHGYYRIFDLGVTNIPPWHFVEKDEFSGIYGTLRELYPDHLLLPFARRVDNDDVACLVVNSDEYPGGNIVIVHMFASPDYAIDAVYDTFWDWFRTAVDEMIEASP